MNRFATLLLTNLTRPQGKTVWQSACASQHLRINARHRVQDSKKVVILSRRRRILVEEHKDPSLTASPQ